MTPKRAQPLGLWLSDKEEGGTIFGAKKRPQKWDDAIEHVGRPTGSCFVPALDMPLWQRFLQRSQLAAKASRCSFCRHTTPAWDKGGRRRVLSQPKQKCVWHHVAHSILQPHKEAVSSLTVHTYTHTHIITHIHTYAQTHRNTHPHTHTQDDFISSNLNRTGNH